MPERLAGIFAHPAISNLATGLIIAATSAVGIDSFSTFLSTGSIPASGIITAVLAGIGAIFAGLAKFLPSLGDLYIKIAQAKVSERSIDTAVFCELQQELHDINLKYYQERCLRSECPTRIKVRLDKIKQETE